MDQTVDLPVQLKGVQSLAFESAASAAAGSSSRVDSAVKKHETLTRCLHRIWKEKYDPPGEGGSRK